MQSQNLVIPTLHVRSLGGSEVTIGTDSPVAVTRWQGDLQQLLFHLVVDTWQLTRDEIFEVIWPKLSVREATNVFHVTKRKLQQVLALTYGADLLDVIEYHGIHYYVADERWAEEIMRDGGVPHVILVSDVALFEDEFERIVKSHQVTAEEWEYALSLYTGDFLAGVFTIENDWVEKRRQALKSKYVSLLTIAGESTLEANPAQALQWFITAYQQDATRENVHRGAMRAYMAVGQRDDVIRMYKTAKKALWKAMKLQPSTTTKELYLQLTGEQPPE